jgi:hypothetical protein
MTAAKALALGALHLSGRRVNARRAAVALAVDAVSHHVADRRGPLRALAEATVTGGFYRNGGAPLLDQAWHIAWLYIAALTAAGKRP